MFRYLLLFISISFSVFAQNTKINSFSNAKRLLKYEVYSDNKTTFYCNAEWNNKGDITLPEGFTTPSQEYRANRLEWEHVIPAEHFGRNFKEWTEGHPDCMDNKGKSFKGRKCAEKVNPEFRYMLSDMYNLYPSIGAVNALRSNYPYTEFNTEYENTFGSCSMKIYNKQAEPPEYTRGAIARTYLYFDKVYPKYSLDDATRELMEKWDKLYPVTEEECQRAKRIEELQGNSNEFVLKNCK